MNETSLFRCYHIFVLSDIFYNLGLWKSRCSYILYVLAKTTLVKIIGCEMSQTIEPTSPLCINTTIGLLKKKEHYYAEKENEAQLKLYFQCLPLISLTARLIFPCDWSVKVKHADGGGYTGSPLHHMPVGHKHLNVTRKLKHFPITLALNLNLLFHKLYKVGDKVSKFLLNRRWMLTFEGRS